jgi:hypothetical protein
MSWGICMGALRSDETSSDVTVKEKVKLSLCLTNYALRHEDV